MASRINPSYQSSRQYLVTECIRMSINQAQPLYITIPGQYVVKMEMVWGHFSNGMSYQQQSDSTQWWYVFHFQATTGKETTVSFQRQTVGFRYSWKWNGQKGVESSWLQNHTVLIHLL